MLFKLPRAVYLGAVCSFVLLTQAAVARAETVENAIESALLYHPSIESAKAVLDAANQDKTAEISGYFPDLSVAGSGGRKYGDNSTSRGLSTTRGAGYSDLWEGSVTASQMLFDGLETPSRIRSAVARSQSADMDLMDTREALALRAVQTYVGLLQARAGLALLKGQEKKVDDYLSRIKASVDEGASDESEHQQARDVRVILDSFITDYEGQIRASEAQYIEITGRLPEGELSMPQPAADFVPPSVEDALSLAEEHHPTLHSAMFDSEAAAQDIAIEKAQVLPDVTGELSYSKTDQRDVIGGESVDAKALVRVNWNFEVGGGQVARIRRKKHEHQQAMARVHETKRSIEQGVRVAYSDLRTARGQLENQKKRVDLNTKLFDTYKVQFDGARISLLQLMQADNQLFNTRLEKVLGEYRVIVAQYSLLASMGRLQNSVAAPVEETGLAAGGGMVEDAEEAVILQEAELAKEIQKIKGVEPAAGVDLTTSIKKNSKTYGAVEIFELEPSEP